MSNHSLNTFQNNKVLLIVAGIFMTLAVLGMVFIVPQIQRRNGSGRKEEIPKTEVIIWGLWDESAVIEELALDYELIDPTVKINYKKVEITNYEDELVRALAEDRGPDIFAIHHTWPYKSDLMNLTQPIPESIITLDDYRDTFFRVVANDFIKNDQIWGIPLFVDTLALYYNKDLFYLENIQNPPIVWGDVQALSKQLTKIDANGNIVQVGIPLGTGTNIARSPDIISLLMLQGGIDLNGSIKYREDSEIQQNYLSSAENVLKFYTDFANPRNTLYTWNLAQNFSLDVFAQKRSAMMLGYAYHIDQLSILSPRLNYGVAKVPQITDDPLNLPVNYANYWGYTVAKRSKNPELAFQFLKYLSSKEVSQKYFGLTKRISPRVDLVSTIKQDPIYGIFAEQALTAQSWNQENNYDEDRKIVNLVDDIVKGNKEIEEALEVFVE